MAFYHKWDVKNDFANVLQFSPLISDSLGSVYLSTHCSFLALNSTSAIKPLFSEHIVIFSNYSSHYSIGNNSTGLQ